MAETYKILDVKVGDQWINDYGKFQSIALSLEGVGEPVQLNKKVKEDGTFYTPKIGDELYGTLEKQVSKNGKEYYKFKAQQQGFMPKKYGKSKEELDGMAWGNALTNATQLVINFSKTEQTLANAIEEVIATAELLVAGRKYD